MELKIDNISYEISSYSIDVNEKQKKITFSIKTTDETVFSASKELLNSKPLTISTELGLFNIHQVKLTTETRSKTTEPNVKNYKIKVIAIC